MRGLIVLLFMDAALALACGLLAFFGYPRFVLAAALALLLLIAVSICLAFRQRRIMRFLVKQTKPKEEENLNEQNELLEKRLELSLFSNQINPHFLYNTLDSIRSEALSSGQDNIASMLEKLARFFRYSISSKAKIVKLSEELSNVNDYYEIQKYRFGERINLTVELEKEELLECFIPKLTLQPLVENAIVHGVEKSGTGGEVLLRIESTEEKIYIHVFDNGEGMSDEELEKMNLRLENAQVEVPSSESGHTGIAIQNINSRLRLCFGEEYGLLYHSGKDFGTDVTVILPLVNDYSRAAYERKLQELM